MKHLPTIVAGLGLCVIMCPLGAVSGRGVEVVVQPPSSAGSTDTTVTEQGGWLDDGHQVFALLTRWRAEKPVAPPPLKIGGQTYLAAALGVVSPELAGWDHRGFIDIEVNGFSTSAVIPEMRAKRSGGPQGVLEVKWTLEDALVRQWFTMVAGERRLLLRTEIVPRTAIETIRLRLFVDFPDDDSPLVVSAPGIEGAVSGASASLPTQKGAWCVIGPQGASHPGLGLLYRPDEVDSVTVHRHSDRAVIDFDLPSYVRGVHLAVWQPEPPGRYQLAEYLRRNHEAFAAELTHRARGAWMMLSGRSALPPPLRRTDAVNADPASRERGFVVFQRPLFARVVHDTRPRDGETVDSLSLTSTLGEYEPVSFSVHALRDLEAVSVTVTDLRGQRVAIPRRNLDLRVIKVMELPRTPSRARRYARYPSPVLLVKDDRPDVHGMYPLVRTSGDALTDIPSGETRQFWLTLYTPLDTPAGDYEGEVRLRVGGRQVAALPLRATILPIVLPPPSQTRALYYRGGLEAPDFNRLEQLSLVDFTHPEDMDLHMHDAARHGFDALTMTDRYPFVRLAVENMRKAGLSGPALYAPWLRAAEAKPWSEYANDRQRLLNYVTKHRLGPLLWLASGIQDPVRFPAVVPPSAGSDAARMATLLLRPPPTLPSAVVLVPAQTLSADPALVGRLHAQTHKVWVHALLGWSESAAQARAQCGLWLQRTGCDGIIVYCYQHSSGDPHRFWGDPSLPWGGNDQMLTYPSRDGPIPTVRWEACREGFDDLRYLHAIERLLALRSEGDAAMTAFHHEMLDDIARAFPDAVSTLTPDELQRRRRQLQRKLSSLLQGLPHPYVFRDAS